MFDVKCMKEVIARVRVLFGDRAEYSDLLNARASIGVMCKDKIYIGPCIIFADEKRNKDDWIRVSETAIVFVSPRGNRTLMKYKNFDDFLEKTKTLDTGTVMFEIGLISTVESRLRCCFGLSKDEVFRVRNEWANISLDENADGTFSLDEITYMTSNKVDPDEGYYLIVRVTSKSIEVQDGYWSEEPRIRIMMQYNDLDEFLNKTNDWVPSHNNRTITKNFRGTSAL